MNIYQGDVVRIDDATNKQIASDNNIVQCSSAGVAARLLVGNMKLRLGERIEITLWRDDNVKPPTP
jgi:hypothetical protein